jgi:hypothetical protein
LERGSENAKGGLKESKEGKLIIWGLIIGFVVAPALISLDFWRWAWDVITWGLNHNWRERLSKILNVTCLLSHSIAAALPCKQMSKSPEMRRKAAGRSVS